MIRTGTKKKLRPAVNGSYEPSNCLEQHVGHKLPTLHVYDELPCLFTRLQNTITALDGRNNRICVR